MTIYKKHGQITYRSHGGAAPIPDFPSLRGLAGFFGEISAIAMDWTGYTPPAGGVPFPPRPIEMSATAWRGFVTRHWYSKTMPGRPYELAKHAESEWLAFLTRYWRPYPPPAAEVPSGQTLVESSGAGLTTTTAAFRTSRSAPAGASVVGVTASPTSAPITTRTEIPMFRPASSAPSAKIGASAPAAAAAADAAGQAAAEGASPAEIAAAAGEAAADAGASYDVAWATGQAAGEAAAAGASPEAVAATAAQAAGKAKSGLGLALAGAGAGFLTVGPLGALAGGAIGYLLGRPKAPKSVPAVPVTVAADPAQQPAMAEFDRMMHRRRR